MNIADDLKSAYEDGYEKGFADGFEAGQRDVQPERKKGKWIYTRPYSAINCSSCHHCSWSMSYEDLVKSFNYCPNCGADMRG